MQCVCPCPWLQQSLISDASAKRSPSQIRPPWEQEAASWQHQVELVCGLALCKALSYSIQATVGARLGFMARLFVACLFHPGRFGWSSLLLVEAACACACEVQQHKERKSTRKRKDYTFRRYFNEKPVSYRAAQQHQQRRPRLAGQSAQILNHWTS